MSMIKGITVTLIEKQQISEDDFGQPVYDEVEVPVDNVLVGQPTSDDITNDLTIYGKHLAYVLAIPKGDAHVWEDTDVIIWGDKYHTYGYSTQGIEEMIPLDWNKKVKVERYG